MSIEIVSASAGSGKTFFLANEVAQAIASGAARPENVLAVTFTTRAANELRARLRARLSGLGSAEAGFAEARIGTVHSVAAEWLRDLALHLGTSPRLRVLSDLEARELFHLAIDEAAAIDADRSFMRRLTLQDWSGLAFELADKARANGIAATELPHHAERSIAAMLAGLPPAGPGVDRTALLAAVDRMIAAPADGISAEAARGVAADAHARIAVTDLIPWELYDRLATLDGAASQRDAAGRIRVLATAYIRDEALRADCAAAIEHVFGLAARAMAGYDVVKQRLGVLDFTDLEKQFLSALGDPEVAAIVAERVDIFLVDEFQDSSPLQVALFSRLAELAKRSVWVGDVKQAIFSFRGTDPTLMADFVRSLPSADGPRILATSWRSRAPLVDVTSHVFVAPFGALGIPSSQVALEPAAQSDDPALGVIVERWRVHGDNRASQHIALASLVARFLGDARARVRDPIDGHIRRPMPGDIAILCRTHASCASVAQAIRSGGVEVAGPSALEAAPEVLLALALLRLGERPADRLARAEAERILDEHPDGSGWIQRVFDEPSDATWWREVTRTADVGVSARLDLVLARPELRDILASWGALSERLARLETIRRRAIVYEKTASSPSVSGFMEAVARGALEEAGSHVAPAADRVNVLTWHASKGLEWPVVVLYDLHHSVDPSPCCVTADGPSTLVATEPLRDRSLRFWPRVVNERQSAGPFATAMRQSAEGRAATQRFDEEELRLLYVAWTRARDRLALAARPSRLTDGVLALLRDRGVPLLREPMVRATWGRKSFDVIVRDSGALTPERPRGHVTVPRRQTSAPRSPAFIQPSRLHGAGSVVRVDDLGGVAVTATARDARQFGLALHDFLVASADDLDEQARLRVAEGCLLRRDVRDIAAGALLDVEDRLIAWIRRTFGHDDSVEHAVPVTVPQVDGAILVGEADLIVRGATGFAIVDHKLRVLPRDLAISAAAAAAVQLAAYASAGAAAWGVDCRGLFVHLPVQGVVVQVEPNSCVTSLTPTSA